MSENVNVAEQTAVVRKEVIKKDRFYLGIQVQTAKKGNNAGNKFGICYLYEHRTYDDNSTGFSIAEIMMSFDKVKELLALSIPVFDPVKVEFEEQDSFYAKPKIKKLIPLV